jgi:hypothetical protein
VTAAPPDVYLNEQVLSARRRSLGDDHPHTLTSMNNLAFVLRESGQLAEARMLHERTHAVLRRI